jgi:hypothetical protein
LASIIERPKRLVALRRDGDDFVVTFYPEDIVVFRHTEPNALRKMCSFFRWKIISDSSGSDDTTLEALQNVQCALTQRSQKEAPLDSADWC